MVQQPVSSDDDDEEEKPRFEPVPLPDDEFKDQLAQVIPHLRAFGRSLSGSRDLADDSSGIDAVKDILSEFQVPVIFITAFPERLLTGERPEPTFLITKPFQRSTVKAAIAQALFFDSATLPA